MAADLFRVVRTRPGTDGVMSTIASGPLSRDEAMRRLNDCATLGMDGVRVVRDDDYRPEPRHLAAESPSVATVRFGARVRAWLRGAR